MIKVRNLAKWKRAGQRSAACWSSFDTFYDDSDGDDDNDEDDDDEYNDDDDDDTMTKPGQMVKCRAKQCCMWVKL